MNVLVMFPVSSCLQPITAGVAPHNSTCLNHLKYDFKSEWCPAVSVTVIAQVYIKVPDLSIHVDQGQVEGLSPGSFSSSIL